MLRTALALAFLVTLSACDLSAEETFQRLDPLSQSLFRATETVPDFGGVKLNGDSVIVYTLGDVAAARAAVTQIFADGVAVKVESRPAQANGSDALQSEVAQAMVRHRVGEGSVEYIRANGYVELRTENAASVRRAFAALEAEDLPISDIIVQVGLPARFMFK